MLSERGDEDGANGLWGSVLKSDLNDAGTAGPCVRKKCSEVEIVREDHETVLSGVRKDQRIWGVGRTDVAPVDRIDLDVMKPLDPARCQVHVNEELHDAAKGSSCSSERQAA